MRIVLQRGRIWLSEPSSDDCLGGEPLEDSCGRLKLANKFRKPQMSCHWGPKSLNGVVASSFPGSVQGVETA